MLSDELWVHSGGDALELHFVSPEGAYSRVVLGAGGHAGVPVGHWQAARPADPPFAHVTCAVAPGFEVVDFDLARRRVLERSPPGLPADVLEMTVA